MDLATVLDDCVHRMRGGESVEDCLADYPEQAAELAPMLRAASALEWLAGLRLPDARRQQTRTALRQVAAASQAKPKRPAWMAFGVRPAGRAFAGVAAILVFLTFAISTVAASRPGDLAYPARVMVERSTVLLQRTTDGQASASLRLANNRLSELEAGLSLPGRAYNPALNALLEEDKGLADLTPHLPAPACEQVARQVAAHAGQLETLAQGNHEPQVATALLPAAVETNALAETILEHNDKTAPTPGDPTPTWHATPAAKKLATTVPVLSVTTQGASTRSQSATTAPSIGTLSKRGAAAGRAAASTSVASPARVAPSASHLQRPLDSPKHGGPQSLPPVKDLPPTPGKASTAKLTSPPAQPSPPSPAPPGIPAPQPAAPPALERPVHGRPVSLPAVAPEPPAPYASGPAIRGLSEAPSSSVIGKGPAVKMQAPEAKQKGRATSRPTQSVRSIER